MRKQLSFVSCPSRQTVCSVFIAVAFGIFGSASLATAQLGEALTGAAKEAAKDAVTQTATEAVQSAATAAGLATGARKFTVVNVLYEGSKIFVPATLAVTKGEKVSVTVINNIPGDPPNHGFSIPAFGVETVVNHGEKKTVEFTADQAGIFDIKCQLHPAHVSGQLIVQE